MGPEGLEPPTLCFEGRCSIQLSYGPVEKFITTRDSCVLAAQAILPVPGGRPIKIIDLARRNFVPLESPGMLGLVCGCSTRLERTSIRPDRSRVC